MFYFAISMFRFSNQEALMEEIFDGSFTQQEPISEIAVSAALRVLRSGRLHRYNVI